jgi:hypothetical protein
MADELTIVEIVWGSAGSLAQRSTNTTRLGVTADLLVTIKNMSRGKECVVIARPRRIVYELAARELVVDMTLAPPDASEHLHMTEPTLIRLPPGATSSLNVTIPLVLRNPHGQRVRAPKGKVQQTALPSIPEQPDLIELKGSVTLDVRLGYYFPGSHVPRSGMSYKWEQVSQKITLNLDK